MDSPSEDMLEFFRAINRVRRAWESVKPAPQMNKSLFTTLMAIAHAGDVDNPEYVDIKLVDGAISLGDLSLLLNQSLPAVSQRIRALEELSYLRRISDDTDRRISRVKLTENGLSEVNKAHIAMKQQMNMCMKNFGDENVPALLDMLNKLASALEDTSKETNQQKEKNV